MYLNLSNITRVMCWSEERAAGMGSRAGLHAQRLVTAMRFDKFDVRGSGGVS